MDTCSNVLPGTLGAWLSLKHDLSCWIFFLFVCLVWSGVGVGSVLCLQVFTEESCIFLEFKLMIGDSREKLREERSRMNEAVTDAGL